jgi:hypothetical protein
MEIQPSHAAALGDVSIQNLAIESSVCLTQPGLTNAVLSTPKKY